MGKIIRNGIEFSSTVDTANNISYDNSLSGLEATTTQKAIDEVVDNVSTLNENLVNIDEWKLLGSATGTTSITLPTSFKELKVYIQVNNLAIYLNVDILKGMLSTTDRQFRTGYHADTDTSAIGTVACNLTSVFLSDVRLNGNTVTSASSIFVYYK